MPLLTLTEGKLLSQKRGETNYVTIANRLVKNRYIIITKEYRNKGRVIRIAYRTTSDGQRILKDAQAYATR